MSKIQAIFTQRNLEKEAFLEGKCGHKKIAKELLPEDIVLEVGCGRGYFKPLFGKNYIGTDIALYKGVDFVSDLIDQKCLKDESIDVIILNNFIEHLYNYSALLKNLFKSLKKSGTAIITVPYSSILHQTPNDYFRFSHYSLERILLYFGMKIVDFETVFSPQTQLNWAHINLLDSMPNGVRNSIAGLVLMIYKKISIILKLISKNISPVGANSVTGNIKLENPFGPYTSPLTYHIKAIKK